MGLKDFTFFFKKTKLSYLFPFNAIYFPACNRIVIKVSKVLVLSEITNLFRLSFNQMIVDTFYKNSGEQIE